MKRISQLSFVQRGFVRLAVLVVAASTAAAEAPAARQKVHLQAAVDVGPLAQKLDKLDEIANLLKASTLILQKRLENLEAPMRSNEEALKLVEQQLVKIEESVGKLEKLLRKPVLHL